MSAALEARIAALEQQLRVLTRRLSMPHVMARTTLPADDTGASQMAQASFDLRVRTIPLAYNFGLTSSPPVGADLQVLFMDGDPSKAVAVASNHQLHRMRNLSPGDTALYDARGISIWLTAAGLMINCGGLPMTVTGNLVVTGDVTAGHGGADQVSLQSHQHGTGPAPTAGT